MNRYFTVYWCVCALLCAGMVVQPAQATIGFQPDGSAVEVPIAGAVPRQDMLLVQGDIFVRPAVANAGPVSYVEIAGERGFGRSKVSALWPNGIIDYSLDESLSAAQRDRIRAAVAHWNDNTSISLREMSGLNSELDQHADYLDFKSGPGCASWVGRQGSAQMIWVSADCSTGSIVHEVGHAIGLLHEHTRFDRDSHIRVLLENVEVGKSVNFDILENGARLIGPYDFDSIMHYGSHFFSGNGNPTILPLNGLDAASIGQRDFLSIGDIAAVNEMYSSDAVLNILSSYDPATNSTLVQLDVSVLSDRGAHSLWLEVTTDAVVALFDNVDGWSCQNLPSGIGCSLLELGARQSSQLLLEIPGLHEVNALNAGLATGTFDSNPVNNGKPVNRPEETLVAAAALNDSGWPGVSKSGGGGALSLPSLLVILGFASIGLRSSRRVSS